MFMNDQSCDDILAVDHLAQLEVIFNPSPHDEADDNNNSGDCHIVKRTCDTRIEAVLYQLSASDINNGKTTMLSEPSPINSTSDSISCSENAVSRDTENNLPETITNALQLLHEYRLEDAEHMFLSICRDTGEMSQEEATSSTVQAMIGLAEIYSKRSRQFRANHMESQWLQIHSISILQSAINICYTELQTFIDKTNKDWFQTQMDGAIKKLRPLEDMFIKSVYALVQDCCPSYQTPYFFFSAPTTPTYSNPNFPLGGTNVLQDIFPILGPARKPSLDSLYTDNLGHTFCGGLMWLSKLRKYCQSRVHSDNFNGILNDLITQSPDGSESSLRIEQSLSSDDDENVSEACIFDTEVTAVDKFNQKPCQYDDGNTDFWNEKELGMHVYDQENWSTNTFVNNRMLQLVSCMTETIPEVDTPETSCADLSSGTVLHDILSPLKEHNIKYTLAQLLYKLAGKLTEHDDLKKSETIYVQVLEIMEEIQDGTVGMLRFYGHALKSLGIVKTKVGEMNYGAKLLRKSLKTFRDLCDDNSNAQIAIALMELGNNYTTDGWDEENIYDHVIDVVREAFDKESSDDSPFKSPCEMTSSVETDDSFSIAATTTSMSGESYNVNIQEAILCYDEAILLFETLSSHKSEYAGTVMRLGNCQFMIKNYQLALECFEKAMILYQRASGRSAIIEHSHVMCMLGVTAFMLHLHPKAMQVYEWGYHMLRHAYPDTKPYVLGLILALLGLTTYKLQIYHKCITWCFQAFEIFTDIYGEEIPYLSQQKLWIVCQTMYTLGNSYNSLNLHDKAISYLWLARDFMRIAPYTDKRQFMRVLQVLGDCYFAQYDYKTALCYYKEALAEGEEISSSSDSTNPDQMSDDMGFHSQLLSRFADAHISMKQYNKAAGYLEEASTMQDAIQEDMKGDLITMFNQLGKMQSITGAVDKAIESYRESLEIYVEVHGKLDAKMCETLGNLALMFSVKACIVDMPDDELEMTLAAEQHFQEALRLEVNPGVCLKYASHLYSQNCYDDAIIYIQDALRALAYQPSLSMTGCSDGARRADIMYGGLEKLMLPEVLQREVDDEDEMVISLTALAYYLLLLCHKELSEIFRADDALINLLKDALSSELRNDHFLILSLLGYAFMDMSLYDEAAETFAQAFCKKKHYYMAMSNCCLCLYLQVWKVLVTGFESFYLHHH